MTAKLHQVIAIEAGVKSKTFAELTEAHHALQKPAMLSGIARAYQPKDEEGDKLPPENTRVQMRAEEMLKATAEIMTKLFDVTATKNAANCGAKGDVQIGDKKILVDVPVTTLLFLEKQVVSLYTFLQKVPTLDPSEEWEYDSAQDAWSTKVSETTKTKKVLKNHIKADATDKHPAQVETFSEDVIVGTWKTRKFSGAIPAVRHKQLMDRVTELQKAIKYAREYANAAAAPDAKIGEAIFGYLFA